MEKISRAARGFDSGNGTTLIGFKSGDMTKNEFTTQIKKAFNIVLSTEEAKAVVEVFDLDGDGKISCSEFLSLFLRMKRAAEREEKQHSKEKHNKKIVKQKTNERKKARKEELIIQNAIEPWTKEDLKSAVGAIATVAADWDSGKAGPAGLAGFQCAGLNPIQFREQLWRTFDLTFTKAELNALCESFDVDGDQMIDGAEFLSLFYRLQKKEQGFRAEQKKAKRVKEKAREEDRRFKKVR